MRWKRKRRLQDLERELASHLELEVEEQIERGLAPEEARFAARRVLGNAAIIQEETRESWGFAWMDRLGQDLRYAFRVLRKSPALSAVIVMTAALGIGANTSIFSIVYAVLLRPLPYTEPERVVSVANVAKDRMIGLGVPDFQYGAWREQATVFDGVAAYFGRRMTITGSGEPAHLRVQVVTPGFLRVLGVTPMLGRDFAKADAGNRGGNTALLSHSVWMQRFGADPSALSRTLTLDGKPYSIAGVLPPSFEFPEKAAVGLLLAMPEPSAQPRGVVFFFNVIARLKGGINVKRAQDDLALISRRLQTEQPQSFERGRAGLEPQVMTVQDRLVGNVKPALLALAGAVGLVLLIVCANISNLLLARSLGRQREIAVRVALGAGRGRVMRQLLTEGILLALAGGAAGLALTFGGVELLRAMAPEGVPHMAEAGVNGAVLAFNIAVSICVGLVFGLAPLRSTSQIQPEAALKQSSRSMTGSRRHGRLESTLIVSETALAFILLVGAGLLIRTFTKLTTIPQGFQSENVLTAQLSLPYWKYSSSERQRAFVEAMLERVRTGPGVRQAAVVACLPFGGFVMTGRLQLEGQGAGPAGEESNPASDIAVNYASADYFQVMQIPILEGRSITAGDNAARPGVAVVNQELVRRFFRNTSPLGKRIQIAGVTNWLEIVGVTGNVKQGGLASEVRPEVFQSAAQSDSGGSAQTLVIRSDADPRALVPWLRSQLVQMDKDLPLPEILPMKRKMAGLVASQVFVMRLLSLFALVAIGLAVIGMYGVLAYSVERRSHEIGIRLALGATRSQIMRMVMRRGLSLSLGGTAIGIAGGLALTGFLESLLYGVTAHDPVTLAIVGMLVIAAGCSAAFWPAQLAAKQDAMAALRAE